MQQKQEDVVKVLVKASSDYRVNEDKKPTEYKIIESINDVLTMIEEAKDDKRVIVNLILKGDDLTGLLYELKEHCGYEPKITYQAGKITFISVEL